MTANAIENTSLIRTTQLRFSQRVCTYRLMQTPNTTNAHRKSRLPTPNYLLIQFGVSSRIPRFRLEVVRRSIRRRNENDEEQ